jgi:hypothetical protein
VDAPRPELYAREVDPDDRRDVAPEQAAEVERQRARLLALRVSLDDGTDPEIAPAGSPEDAERRERLASLGYVALPSRAAAARLDPKDALPGFLAVEKAEERLEDGEFAAARDLVAPFLAHDPRTPACGTRWPGRAPASTTWTGRKRRSSVRSRSPGGSPSCATPRAAILRRRGDERGVEAELRAILKDDPRAVEASLELSAMAVRRGAIVQAKEILLAARAAGARDPDLFDRLGQHLLREGEEQPALALFGEARPCGPRTRWRAWRWARRHCAPGMPPAPSRRCVPAARSTAASSWRGRTSWVPGTSPRRAARSSTRARWRRSRACARRWIADFMRSTA